MFECSVSGDSSVVNTKHAYLMQQQSEKDADECESRQPVPIEKLLARFDEEE